MAIREIRVVPDPVLRTPCDPIKEITPAVRHLVQDLLDTVDDPGRAGLSANQIGVNLRHFPITSTARSGMCSTLSSKRPAVNNTEMRDACLCRDCGTRPVAPITLVCVASIWKARRSCWKVVALWAAMLQHETDHLNGHVYLDRLEKGGTPRGDALHAQSPQVIVRISPI